MSADTAPTLDTQTPRGDAAHEATWGWRPPLPLESVPIFVWPPRPREALRYCLSLAFFGSVLAPFTATAVLTWLYLQPALERCVELRADWILQMYARNLGLMLLVAGGLHLYFHTFKRQGSERKFDRRDLERSSRKFFSSNQVRDNMLHTRASCVTVWTAYEVLFFWAWSNGWLPLLPRSERAYGVVCAGFPRYSFLELAAQLFRASHAALAAALPHCPRVATTETTTRAPGPVCPCTPSSL